MTIDLSAILPCPNCNSKPRATETTDLAIPTKIRCSNKNCELSRESVPTEFWQAIKREGDNPDLSSAYDQFRASLEAERQKGDECFEMCRRTYDVNIKRCGSRDAVIGILKAQDNNEALEVYLAIEKIIKKYEAQNG